MESMKATEMKGSFCFVFLLFKGNAECFFPFVSLRMDKVTRRHVWIRVETGVVILGRL